MSVSIVQDSQNWRHSDWSSARMLYITVGETEEQTSKLGQKCYGAQAII